MPAPTMTPEQRAAALELRRRAYMVEVRVREQHPAYLRPLRFRRRGQHVRAVAGIHDESLAAVGDEIGVGFEFGGVESEYFHNIFRVLS